MLLSSSGDHVLGTTVMTDGANYAALPDALRAHHDMLAAAAAEGHAVALYPPSASSIRTQGSGLSAVDAAAVGTFQARGFVVIDDAFDEEAVSGALGALDDICAGHNASFAAAAAVFDAAAQVADLYGSDVALKKAAHRATLLQREATGAARVRKVQGMVVHDARIESIANDAALRSAVRALLGGREGDEVYLLQDTALIKGPGGREKPWHQDQAYFDVHNDVAVCGVWIALDPATVENGCMFLLPAAHRTAEGAPAPISHFQRRDWQICDEFLLRGKGEACSDGREADVSAEGGGAAARAQCAVLRPGGVLFFDGLAPHGTPTNTSAQRRRALQLHFVLADRLRWCGKGARLSDFSGAQHGATC